MAPLHRLGVIHMHTDTTKKHSTEAEKDEKKESHHRHSHPKHQAAEAMEDSQWKKHPGGG